MCSDHRRCHKGVFTEGQIHKLDQASRTPPHDSGQQFCLLHQELQDVEVCQSVVDEEGQADDATAESFVVGGDIHLVRMPY